jgi:hypothetical protein
VLIEGLDLTADVVVISSVNPDVVGTYIVTYNVTDWEGNPAEEQIRTVHVVEAPLFQILAIMDTGEGALQLTWNSRSGGAYTVWSRADLVEGEWIKETTVWPEGELGTWTDSDTTTTRKFYRVGIE